MQGGVDRFNSRAILSRIADWVGSVGASSTQEFVDHHAAPTFMSEVHVRLPDGNTVTVRPGSTVLDVAEKIGPGLAKAALAGRIDGELVDLRTPINQDGSIEIVTSRDPDGGHVIRHSAEHVMAEAVLRLFPDAHYDAGRADHSEKFQYDFRVEDPFTPEDLERIEKEMESILSEGSEFSRRVVTREEARALFREQGNELKLSRLDDIPKDSEITLFSSSSVKR